MTLFLTCNKTNTIHGRSSTRQCVIGGRFKNIEVI